MDRPLNNPRNSTMNKLITVAAATLATTIAVSFATSAFALPVIKPRPHTHYTHDLTCRVRGDNLFITNFGDTNAESGSQISWASPATGDAGTLLLPKMLAPGEELMIADVLTDLAGPGSRCDVAFV
jgi:hypothetical protein